MGDIPHFLHPNAPDGTLSPEKNITSLEDFIKYVINEHKLKNIANSHWRSINDLCQPCRHSYQFIGSIHTIDDDMAELEEVIYNVKNGTRKLNRFNCSSCKKRNKNNKGH